MADAIGLPVIEIVNTVSNGPSVSCRHRLRSDVADHPGFIILKPPRHIPAVCSIDFQSCYLLDNRELCHVVANTSSPPAIIHAILRFSSYVFAIRYLNFERKLFELNFFHKIVTIETFFSLEKTYRPSSIYLLRKL